MAGKQIDLNELSAAVDTFCKIFDNCSYVKPGPDMFEVTADGEKILVSLVDGKIDCPRKPEMKEKLIGIILDQRGSEAPKEAISAPVRTNLPAKARNGNGGALAKAGAAIRDIQVQDMTFEDIRNFLCPAASDKDAYMFLQLCKARNLNPFCNEAYLVPYEDKKSGEVKCSMIVGKEAFMRKAEQHPNYRGFKAGVIVSKDEELIYREGTFTRKGETLEGGWAEVYRDDRNEPVRSEVSLAEYNKGFSVWNDKKATMIRKVAVVQAHREAFPSDLSGCYSSDEMGIDPEKEVAEAA